MTKFRERMQATGRSMRMLAEVAGVSSSLVCYIAQGYAHFPEYEQLCRVCDFMGCKPTDLHTKDELRRWYGVGEPRRKSKEGSPRVRIDREDYDHLSDRYGKCYVNEAIRIIVHDVVQYSKSELAYAIGMTTGGGNDTTGT